MTDQKIEKIKKLLIKHPGIKAREIAKHLKADCKITLDKSEVNVILYKHKDVFAVDDKFCWTVKEVPNYITKESGLEIEGIISDITMPVTGKTGVRIWTKRDVLVKDKLTGETIAAAVWNNKIDLRTFEVGNKVKMTYVIKEKTKTGVAYNEVLALVKLHEDSDGLPF